MIIFSLVLPVPGVEPVSGLYELFLLGRDIEYIFFGVTCCSWPLWADTSWKRLRVQYIFFAVTVTCPELVPGLYELFLLGNDLEYIFFCVTCPWR
jgi:hypothetical protein